ncbi:MAG: hypothetical protein IJS15_05370, partial [Victivallales bacterium]|nr:hypothetical protein [Victivallales bacterium]
DEFSSWTVAFLRFVVRKTVLPHRLMAIEAPCRSASLHGKAQKNFKAARPWAALVPTALRLPTAVILPGFAAYLLVSKACIGSNAINSTLAVVISIGKGLRKTPLVVHFASLFISVFRSCRSG